MYLYKEFKNSELEIIGAITKWYWTFGIQIHWNRITKKDIPDLAQNCYILDIHILCFSLSFDYWGKLNSDED